MMKFVVTVVVMMQLATLTIGQGAAPSKAAPSSVEVLVDAAEIGVAERDQTTTVKTQPLNWPAPAAVVLEADHHQKVLLRFALKNKANQQLLAAHQVFVQLSDDSLNKEIGYVAEPENAAQPSQYKFDLNVAVRAKDFGYQSGTYTLRLIVGDESIKNPFIWTIGQLKLSFPPNAGGADLSSKPKSEAPWMKIHYGARPEIKHQFREPEKRPSTFVSDAFTALLLVPILILLGLWASIGVNLNGLPISLSTLAFHASLGAIFVLYTLFWLRLNMFTTLKCLSGLGVVALLSGHSLLRNLAGRRDKTEKSS